MSRYACGATYDDDIDVTVVIGYDDALDYVFMTIDDGDDEHPIYSNLNDPDAGLDCRDLDYFRRILKELAIAIPECMFTETLRDQNARVGNREVYHQLTDCPCAR
jgi:hypothetical protein